MILFSYLLISTMLFLLGFFSNILSPDIHDKETRIAVAIQSVMVILGIYLLVGYF